MITSLSSFEFKLVLLYGIIVSHLSNIILEATQHPIPLIFSKCNLRLFQRSLGTLVSKNVIKKEKCRHLGLDPIKDLGAYKSGFSE